MPFKKHCVSLDNGQIHACDNWLQVPELCEDLLSSVDQPLKIARDKTVSIKSHKYWFHLISSKVGKDYLLCDYNRDGDSYRCVMYNCFCCAYFSKVIGQNAHFHYILCSSSLDNGYFAGRLGATSMSQPWMMERCQARDWGNWRLTPTLHSTSTEKCISREASPLFTFGILTMVLQVDWTVNAN